MITQALIAAIKQGNLGQFKKLMSSVNEENFLMSDENGNTLVHLAAIHNQAEILSLLLESAEEYASPVLGVSNSNGFTPLECCHIYSSSKALSLLESAPKLSDSSRFVIAREYEKIKKLPAGGFRREGFGKIIMVASALGDVSALEILFSIRSREDLLLYRTKDGWSTAHFAAYNDRLDAIKLFPEKFAAEITDNQGNTPFMIAAGRGSLKVIEYLLEKGADLHKKNKDGENASFFAVENGQLETLQFLNKAGIDLFLSNAKGETTLMRAAQHGHLDMVRYLLEQGIPVNQKNKQGKTAFQLVLEAKNLEIADFLFTKISQKEKEDALFDAIKKGDFEAVQWLVRQGVSLSAQNESKMTPFLLAASLGNIQLMDYFLSQQPSSIHDGDDEGDKFLFVAIKNHQVHLVKILVERGLVSHEDKNSKGQTPLLAAAKQNAEGLVDLFRQKGFSLEDRDAEGNNAFHLLLAKGYWGKTMEYLFNHCPHLLLEKNNNNETPLHTAILLQRTDEIKEMLRLTTSHPQIKTKMMEDRDAEGNTPLLLALQCKNWDAVPVLCNAGADILAKNNKHQSVITINYLNMVPQEILKSFFEAYQLDYREYYNRRRLYFIFGGEKLNEVLKFPNAEVKLGLGLFDDGVCVLKTYLKAFIQEKHPECSSQFNPLLSALDKLQLDSTVIDIINRLDSEGMAFQATGFTGHSVLATLKNMQDGSMKLSLAERGGRLGGAPFLNDENRKFAASRSIIVPAEKRQEVIELLFKAKYEPQTQGIDMLFNQIPVLVGKPYQFSTVYQKKFFDICFYSNPKTGLYEEIRQILGEEKGKTFYKEFELYMREQELKQYKEFCELNHPGENVQENPIIVAAQELIEKRQEALYASQESPKARGEPF
ncbi:ankyrin repeat domain-containing protein [Fluoribacter dumoffii]|uniref:ankyrin repeat domain-containing protein n=1 Tax=Fluoribacter dumoffii TaxID=463 RepID=UPI00026C7781|nr:ankyrin repeat domain-containing protein [Fluoribacter dumoffii]